MKDHLTILGISGSLRQGSSGTILLDAFAQTLPATVSFEFYKALEFIPPFNPDHQATLAVEELRKKVHNADAVVISTPEYAFGVPGVLKNALDWLVFTGEFNEKPVAAISSSSLSTGGDKALASLLLTLAALGAHCDSQSALSIGSAGLKIHEGLLKDSATFNSIKNLANRLLDQAAKQKHEGL